MLQYEKDFGPGASRAMAEALESRDRSLAGPTAPAKALFLWNVEYYASPTRPGRGDYWVRGRGAAEEGGPSGQRLVPGIGLVDGGPASGGNVDGGNAGGGGP
jgi:hypothetical protein